MQPLVNYLQGYQILIKILISKPAELCWSFERMQV